MRKKTRLILPLALALLAIALVLTLSLWPSGAQGEMAVAIEWSRQFNANDDQGVCMAAEPGGVYVAQGDCIRKYNPDGTDAWTNYLDVEGGPNHSVSAVSVYSGGVYLAGVYYGNPNTTSGDFGGGFIRKYDAAGTEAWTQYLEETISWSPGWTVCADATGVYLAGNTHSADDDTQDGFLRKFDAGGSLQWMRYLGFGTLDTHWGVCADGRNIYVSGDTHDYDAGADYRFLGKYDTSGSEAWTKSFARGETAEVSLVAVDAAGVYLAEGSSFLRKYDESGNESWSREIASGQGAKVRGLATYGGGIYVAGLLSGAVDGQTGQGGTDAFVCLYDTAGNPTWARQFGSSADDRATVVSAGAAGLFAAGRTEGTMPVSLGSGTGYVSRLTANAYPDRPVNVSPASGETAVSPAAPLQGSAFNDADGDGHAASRWQIRSNTGDYVNPVYDSGTAAASTNVTVPQLAWSTTYYWRVGYQDSRGLWSSYSLETPFTTAAEGQAPPAVATTSADGVGSSSATLRLSLTGLGSAASVQVSFDWGPGTAYGNSTTPQAMTGMGAFSFDLTGLAPATEYHFRAKAEGDGTVYGDDMSFATLTAAAAPPAVATGDASSITDGSALLAGQLTSTGTAASVTVAFVWGTTRGGPYPNETAGSAAAAGDTFSFNLGGLAPGTTFYYRARAVGDGTGYGSEKTFATTGGKPVISGLAAGSGRQGDSLTVTISGANLADASSVAFGDGIIVEEVRVVSDFELSARIVIGNKAEAGTRDVSVTTPRGTGTATGGFEVREAGSHVRAWLYVAAGAAGVAGLLVATLIGMWLRHAERRGEA